MLVSQGSIPAHYSSSEAGGQRPVQINDHWVHSRPAADDSPVPKVRCPLRQTA